MYILQFYKVVSVPDGPSGKFFCFCSGLGNISNLYDAPKRNRYLTKVGLYKYMRTPVWV